MDDLWKSVGELAIELHPQRIEAIAKKIAILKSPNDFQAIKGSFGANVDRKIVDRLGEVWLERSEVTPLELAASIRASSATASLMERRGAVEMVWTGPRTEFIATRHTEQVLLEVIAAAQYRLFIVSFVFYEFDSVVKAIQNAIAKDVQVDVLLESSKAHGGSIGQDCIESFRQRIPSANLYTWTSEAKARGGWTGSVHAKCVVADDRMAFITSANLTFAAMEKNMELGVLIRGGDLPDRLDRHLDALVTSKLVELA